MQLLECLFLSAEPGTVVFMIMDWLSPNSTEDLSRGTPNIRSLYLKSMMDSTAILPAMSSEPYVEVSTVFCLL